MSILLQQHRPRTEPKLPTIINKNLVVLPWDWELPSTILMSSWARKHKQCKGRYHEKSNNSFCGQGLVLHYYGYDGEEETSGHELGKAAARMSISDNYFVRMEFGVVWSRVPRHNDIEHFNFYEIGRVFQYNSV